jgi:hypothetical protein
VAIQAKVWFAHKNEYGYVNLHKTTKLMLKKCNELGGVHYCYLQSVEDELHKHAMIFIAYGEIDERDYRWKRKKRKK